MSTVTGVESLLKMDFTLLKQANKQWLVKALCGGLHTSMSTKGQSSP